VRGELLAELDPRDVELQVSATRSAFEEARSRQQRMQRLLEHQAVSRQEAEAARTHFAQARSAYDNALDLLKDTKIKAPFPGVIEATYVDNYQRVQAGEAILRLVDPHTTTVKFTMPEQGLRALADTATRFEVAFDNYRGVRFAARLKDYARTSSDASGFPVSLKLDRDAAVEARISPGMTCKVTMRTADDATRSMAVPLTAVYAPAEGGTYVWVVGADDRVERRSVVLGDIFGRDMVSVLSGVESGEVVVTAGVYRLREGERVKILNR